MRPRPSSGLAWLRIAACAVFVAITFAVPALAQPEGHTALLAFQKWQAEAVDAKPGYNDALKRYREHLMAQGLSPSAADRTIRLVMAHDEGVLYNRVYASPPDFNTKPNQLLVSAVEGVKPGRALDVGMGQGRNALFLAGKGWDVTGFDVADVGLKQARQSASATGAKITTVHASDEEFDFGRERWDLIAIIYAIEKRSVHRVRDAFRPGGLVVIEAGHRETSNAEFDYHTNELLKIFEGFRNPALRGRRRQLRRGPEQIRLVRLVARKPE